jgi:putative FmdB family regulatory protein
MCPLYEFKCAKCDSVVTCLQKLTDPNPKCETCGEDTEKQVSTYGGYHMYSGPSSVRPKGAGSFKKAKK